VKQFEMTTGLNDSPKFIQALTEIVQGALAQDAAAPVPVRTRGRKLAAPQYAAAAGD
jgi:hypothetical protein